VAEAYDAGRRVGFGVSALALSLVAFLSLLGLEKAFLAIVLGALALKGEGSEPLARRLGTASILLSITFLLTALVLFIVFQDRFAELFRLLKDLS
jgi:hypothetical protein